MEAVETQLSFRNINLPFRTKNTEIDYFKIDPEILGIGEFAVREEEILLAPDEQLSLERHFTSLDHSEVETVVLNMPVGAGKTTICYNLIRKYHDEGYYVIICSPFQKLVEKDYDALRQLMPETSIYNYKQLAFSDDFNGSINQMFAEFARVQVMTINCLLQNPGDNHFEQAFHKRRFLNALRQRIGEQDKKVIFFFDEIHESVENFKNEFIPNLMKWNGLVHKCYVSSATYIPASIPVIRYISYLTLGHISIYNTPRVQKAIKARLHLHFTTNIYSPKYLKPLNPIISLIEAYTNRGSKINILSGYKAIVKALTDKKKRDEIALVGRILSLNPNICTGETENEFNPEANNIGTNFKTGVNINEDNGALIIILPILNKESTRKEYGIFTDGIPSLIQSVARVRGRGDIHIFMYAPESILDLESHTNNIPEQLHAGKETKEFQPVNNAYAIIQQKYNTKVLWLRKEISFLEDTLNNIPELKYHYPTLQEYLIEKGQQISVKSYEWLGKGLSPYVLWAAINNQFCNAILTSISFQERNIKIIELQEGTGVISLANLLSNEQKINLARLSLSDGFTILPIYLSVSREPIIEDDGGREEVAYTNYFTYREQQYPIEKLKNLWSVKSIFVKLLVFLKTGLNIEIEKDQYIRTCINNTNSLQTPTELSTLYRRFHSLKEHYIEQVLAQAITPKEERIIHKDFHTQLSNNFIGQVIELIYELKEKDKLLTSYFSFFQKHTDILKTESIDVRMKRMISTEFDSLFLNFGGRKSYQGKKNEYLLIPDQFENQSNINASFLG